MAIPFNHSRHGKVAAVPSVRWSVSPGKVTSHLEDEQSIAAAGPQCCRDEAQGIRRADPSNLPVMDMSIAAGDFRRCRQPGLSRQYGVATG